MTTKKYYAVLTIAGSDSGGGAGIQADLKTFSALGCFGTSAITAITVQNTCGVFGIHSIPPDVVHDQIKVVMDDIQPSAIKIGMVHSVPLVHAIVKAISTYNVPVVFDPVMVATSGDKLIEEDTIDCIKKELFPLCDLITPNIYEAQLLSGRSIRSKEEMKAAAMEIMKTKCAAVLVKGAHIKGEKLYDFYLDQSGKEEFLESDFIATNNTHGTGCTLSSAIAAFMARGMDRTIAIKEAKWYVHRAIEKGSDVQTGKGHGPLNHFFNPQKQIIHELE